MGEIQLHGKPSKGIAPQPMGTQGDQKEKEVRILLQVGNEKEKEKEELKKARSPGKVHRWLEKRSSRPIRKRSLAAGGKDQYREKLISCWTQRTPLGALRGQRW